MIYFGFILAYLILLIGVSLYRSRALRTEEDFMVAGRRLSTSFLIFTLIATWIGSGSLIAGAEFSFRKGFSALWMPAGAWVGILIVYLFAHRIRKFAQYTVPDILETRYNPHARILGTLTIIVAYTAIVSYQFRAGGLVLNLVTGIDLRWGTLITAAFVIIFTATAGMISIASIDIFNGTMIILGVAVGFPFLLHRAGGWEGVRSSLPPDHFTALGDMSMLAVLGYFLPTMFLLLGESNVYQKLFSARDERVARKAVVGWITGTIVVETLIVALAVVGSGMFGDKLARHPEMTILYAAVHGVPVAVGILILCAAVAIIVSTADSFLLVPATNVIRDVFQIYIRREIPERRLLLYSRLTVVLLGILAYVQLNFFPSVLAMAIYAYTVYGAGITPAALAAFFWRRAAEWGGVTSVLAGLVVTITWKAFGEPFGVPAVIPAVACSFLALTGVSLLSAPPPREKWAPFWAK